MKKYFKNIMKKIVKEDLNSYIKDHPKDKDNFILSNIAGLEWQMLKNGKVYSEFPDHVNNEPNTVIAISNNDRIEDNEVLKQKAVAILREKIHNSVETINSLASKAGYEDFEIDYNYIMNNLRLKSYEMFDGD